MKITGQQESIPSKGAPLRKLLVVLTLAVASTSVLIWTFGNTNTEETEFVFEGDLPPVTVLASISGPENRPIMVSSTVAATTSLAATVSTTQPPGSQLDASTTTSVYLFVADDFCAPFGDLFADFPNNYLRNLWQVEATKPASQWNVQISYSNYVERSSGRCPDPRVQPLNFSVSQLRLAIRMRPEKETCIGSEQLTKSSNYVLRVEFSKDGVNRSGPAEDLAMFGECRTREFAASMPIWTSSYGWNPSTPRDRATPFWIRFTSLSGDSIDSGWVQFDVTRP
jgi:hypothetical protein